MVSSDSAVPCSVVVFSGSDETAVGTGVLAYYLKFVAAAQWFVSTVCMLISVDFKLSK